MRHLFGMSLMTEKRGWNLGLFAPLWTDSFWYLFFLLFLKADFTLISLTFNDSRPTTGMNVIFIEEEKLQEELCSAAAFQCGKFKVLNLHHYNSSKWSKKITSEAQILLTSQMQRLTSYEILMLNLVAIWQEFREERRKWSGKATMI